MEAYSGPEDYFSSYEDLEVHKTMLEDNPRLIAYRNAILGNKPYFENKIVMDVGCGTGILSLFCAQAGAKKIYAVEASNLAKIATEIIKENGFKNVIEVMNSKVEELELPNNTKVDVIVSEWMGFYLLHEGMLDSVLFARNKFLKEDGAMFPESATLYVAPCSVPSLYQNWNDIHGVSMSSFAKQLRISKYNKPEILTVKPEEIIGEKVAVCWINLKEDEISDLDTYSIQHVVGAIKSGALFQGLCLWFECKFPILNDSTTNVNECVILDTSPESAQTHWKQTVIVLPQEQEMDLGEPIAFTLEMRRDKVHSRRYNLEVTIQDPEEVEHPLPCTCDMTKCILIKSVMNQYDHPIITDESGKDNVEESYVKISEAKNQNNCLEEDIIEDDIDECDEDMI